MLTCLVENHMALEQSGLESAAVATLDVEDSVDLLDSRSAVIEPELATDSVAVDDLPPLPQR
ncbi:MAG TPA: hypothetical protein DDY91_22485, partial [Planctomycetaceae bacterium]|nr:hypothetical protein [Planctomycetaceae bacterium]